MGDQKSQALSSFAGNWDAYRDERRARRSFALSEAEREMLPTKVALGEAIRELLKIASPTEIARTVGISRTTVYVIEASLDEWRDELKAKEG